MSTKVVGKGISSAEVMEKIKERGYWEIALEAPADRHGGEKFTFDELVRLIEDSQVGHRIMPYPLLKKPPFSDYVDAGTRVESYAHWADFLFLFRFYRSGRFVHYLGLPEDRRDDVPPPFAEWDPVMQKPRPDPPFLGFRSTVHQVTEIFLFASRLARKGVFGDRVRILIKLHDTRGRILKFDNPVPFEYKCRADTIGVAEATKTPYELMLEHDKLAADACAGAFEPFGLPSEPAKIAIKGAQESLYDGR